MSAEDGRKVLRVSNGGAIHHGQSVQFDLEIEGGTTEHFHCAYDALPKIVENLRLGGQVAEQLRRGLVQASVETVYAHGAIDVRAGTDVQTEQVVVQFRTKGGIPVVISMSPTLAKKTIESLKKAIAQRKSGRYRS